MNSSKKTVLISVVGIVVAIGLMVGVGSGIARRVGDSVRRLEIPALDRSVERTTQNARISVDLVDFTSVYSAGGWSLTITRGDTFNVDVSGTKSALEDVEVFTRGDTLHLEFVSGARTVTGNMHAVVSIPDLERVQTAGNASVVITGFDLDSLDIEVDGAANITARDGRIGELSIDSDGAATFNFSDVQVQNAEVEMDGASNLDISMAGGELNGVLRGLGNVTFTGQVSDESIRIDGLGRVHRK